MPSGVNRAAVIAFLWIGNVYRLTTRWSAGKTQTVPPLKAMMTYWTFGSSPTSVAVSPCKLNRPRSRVRSCPKAKEVARRARRRVRRNMVQVP